mgnify:FL=1
MRIDKNTTIRLGDRNIVKVKLGDVVIWQKDNTDYLYIQNTYSGSNTITFTTTASTTLPSSDKYSNQVEYSTDKVNWTTLTFDPSTPQTVTINTGEKLYLRNDTGVFNYYGGSTNRYNTKITVSQINIIGGNINTLLDYNNPDTVPLSHTCFFGLFQDNSATTDVSGLKFGNNTLNTECYRNLFRNCTSITATPELPNITLAEGCYYSLFQGCTSLTETPQLPAKTLVTNCYKGIFQNCSSLNSITVYADDISATNCTSNWLSGVASSGTFNNYGSATYTTNSPSGIPTGWTEVKPTWSWNVVTDGTYPFELNSNGYYESTNKGQGSSYSYATLNYSGFDELVLECINSGEQHWDYGIISQPDVELSKSDENDGETGGTNVFHTFRVEHSTNPVQITIPSDKGSHFITIKYKKDGGVDSGNDSFQFKVIEP